MSYPKGSHPSKETLAILSVINTKHGHSHRGAVTPTYGSWRGMYKRCNQPTMHNYDSYGGRGIKMLYPSVLDLIADIGEKPSPEYCIHRIDSDGNYEPGNCEWILISEHNRSHGAAKGDAARLQH